MTERSLARGPDVMELLVKIAAIFILFHIVVDTIRQVREPLLGLDRHEPQFVYRVYVVWLVVRLGAALLVTLYLFFK